MIKHYGAFEIESLFSRNNDGSFRWLEANEALTVDAVTSVFAFPLQVSAVS